MDYTEAIAFLKDYVFELGSGAALNIEGEIGFGRECVGILASDGYLDYGEDCEVETPPHAYHKGPYLAVLGRGEDRLIELAEWCERLKAAGYTKCEVKADESFMDGYPASLAALLVGMGKHQTKRLVKR